MLLFKSAILISSLYLLSSVLASESTNTTTANMAPVELGRNIREQFLFDPKYTSLNHGSFGALPKVLVPLLQDLHLKSEMNPDRWLRRDMFPEIEKNKETLAQLIHAHPDELVFVFNAMTGINTVARSVPFEAGDKIIYVSLT